MTMQIKMKWNVYKITLLKTYNVLGTKHTWILTCVIPRTTMKRRHRSFPVRKPGSEMLDWGSNRGYGLSNQSTWAQTPLMSLLCGVLSLRFMGASVRVQHLTDMLIVYCTCSEGGRCLSHHHLLRACHSKWQLNINYGGHDPYVQKHSKGRVPFSYSLEYKIWIKLWIIIIKLFFSLRRAMMFYTGNDKPAEINTTLPSYEVTTVFHCKFPKERKVKTSIQALWHCSSFTHVNCKSTKERWVKTLAQALWQRHSH